jgi:hypothetical protein
VSKGDYPGEFEQIPVIVYEAKKKLKMDLERLRQLLEGGK